MIFDKILKRGGIEFDIILDKDKYKAGQKVKGYLTVSSKKEVKVRSLRLIAEGIESTRISVSERSSSSSSSSSSSTVKTKFELNAFFSIDLSDALQGLYKNDTIDNDSVFSIKSGITGEIPFEFILPLDAHPSYRGKHATISYHVKATADRDNWFDKNKKVLFAVTNSQHNQNQLIANKDKEHESFSSGRTRPTTVQDDDEGIPKRQFKAPSCTSMTGEGKINIDLSKIIFSTKGKFDYTKESNEAKVEFIPKESDGKSICPYPPGETIKGNVIVTKDITGKKINHVEISINGIEYAYAEGYERITQMERYVQKAHLKKDGEPEEERRERRLSNTKSYENDMASSSSNNPSFPFEIKIPESVNRSYAGKYSEYFWGLDAKINLGLSKDLHAKKLIEIS